MGLISLNNLKKFRVGLLLLSMLLLFTSCGLGGNRPSDGSENLADVEIRIDWPASSNKPQYLPDHAQSIKVAVAPKSNPAAIAATVVINRPNTRANIKAPIGEVIFTAEAYDQPDARGNTVASANVDYTVVAGKPNVVHLTLSPEIQRVEVTLAESDLSPGETTQATAIAYDPSNRVVLVANFEWHTSDANVATVDQNGKVTAVNPGTARIIAKETQSQKEGSATVTVTETTVVISRIELGPAYGQLPVGGKVKLLATAYDAHGALLEGVEFQWETSDPGVLAVGSDGEVLAKTVGTATITVSAGGKSDSATLEVTPASDAPAGVTWRALEPPVYKEVRAFASSSFGTEYVTMGGWPYNLFVRAGPGETWRPLYINLPVYQINSLAVSPDNPDELWAETNRKVYVSRNGGLVFKLSLDASTDLTPLQFHPLDSSVLYAGSYRSTDRGATWEHLSSPCDASLDQPTAEAWPQDVNVVFLHGRANEGPVCRSDDGGATWQTLTLPNDAELKSFAIAQNGDLFALGWDPGAREFALYYSSNKGDTWAKRATLDPTHFSYYVEGLLLADNAGNTLYVYKDEVWAYSTDGGQTFSYTTFPESLCCFKVYAYPGAPGTVFVLVHKKRLYRSGNYGQSWDLVLKQDGYPNFFDLYFANDRIYVTGGNGLWVSTNQGASFSRLRENRGLFSVHFLGADRTNPDLVVAAWYNLYKSQDGGYSWSKEGDIADIRALAQTRADASSWFAMVGDYADIWSSADNLESFTWVGRVPFQRYARARLVPGNTVNLIYAAMSSPSSGIYRSDDGGATWHWRSQGLEHTVVSDLVVHPDDDQLLFVGTHHGVYKSEDGGETWVPINRGLGNLEVTSLCLAADKNTLVAGTADGGVYISLDQGGTWSHSATIGSYTVRDVACDPSDASVIYAATIGGVYKSRDKGATWTLASKGLTSPFAEKLWISPDGQTLYLGTSDVGIFRGTPSDDQGAEFRTQGIENWIERLNF